MATSTRSTGPLPARTRLTRGDRRSQLLRAAQGVFAASGYHAAAMDEIAERAGITKPVLYQHFPGKRELYLAVLDGRCTELADAVRAALAPPAAPSRGPADRPERAGDPDEAAPSLAEAPFDDKAGVGEEAGVGDKARVEEEARVDEEARVAATVDAVFAFVDRDDAPWRLVFESDLRSDPDVSARLDRLDADCAAAVADVVQRDTGLARERAQVLSVALVGSAQVAARSWVAAGRTVPRADAVALITQLLWRGLRGFPRTSEPARARPEAGGAAHG